MEGRVQDQRRDRAGSAAAGPPESSAGARYYGLALLGLIYLCNNVDRQILIILLEPIKHALDLTDTQLGFLTGFAFALFYAVAGVPLAAWADRGSRKTLIALALTAWSLLTILSGAAANFMQLALARIGVGIGEAGCNPPAHSMISDSFGRERRSTALALYGLGIPLGAMTGFFVGGWLGQAYGWRTAFFIVGAPGLVLALLFWLTVREPTRVSDTGELAPLEAPGLVETLRYLAARPTFVHLLAGGALITCAGAAIVAFTPAYLARVFGLSLREIGTWIGVIAGAGGGAGMLAGGLLSDRFGAYRPAWRLWVVAGALFVAFPLALLAFLSPSLEIVLLALLGPFALASFFYQAATFAQAQSLAGARMRGMTAAILLFVLNLVGQGCGPLLAGALSDILHPIYGDAAIRYALAATSCLMLWAGAHYVRAGAHLERDLARAAP